MSKYVPARSPAITGYSSKLGTITAIIHSGLQWNQVHYIQVDPDRICVTAFTEEECKDNQLQRVEKWPEEIVIAFAAYPLTDAKTQTGLYVAEYSMEFLSEGSPKATYKVKREGTFDDFMDAITYSFTKGKMPTYEEFRKKVLEGGLNNAEQYPCNQRRAPGESGGAEEGSC